MARDSIPLLTATPLPAIGCGIEVLVVRAGSFDNAEGMKITANIWTRSARPWAYIDPESQQLPGQPG